MTLTTTGSGTTKYKITDKNGNASYFDTNGRLSKLENNQATKSNISITYTTTTGWLISTVTDGVGRVYSFTYTNNLLSKISYKGTGSSVITYVNYGYTGSDLTSITDKDGKTVRYTYGTNHLLTSATDVDGYKLSYTYNTTEETVPSRVATVTETDDSVQGGKLKIDYAHNQTTFTEILKNGSSANQLIYQFNNWGNTVSIQDGEGRAEFARWATDTNTSGAKGNQLSLTSKLQNTVGNVVKNSTFESAVDWRTNKNTLVASSSSEFAYHGTKSLKLKNSANAEVYALGPTFTIQPNETYTFSAYIKTVDTYVNIGITDYSNYQTSFGPGISANSDWTRLELSYTNTTSTVKTMMPSFCVYNVGAVYVDSIQVEKAPTASRYNLIENGDFRHSGTPAYGWTGTNLGTSDGSVSATSAAPQLDATVLKIVGSPTSQKRVSQTVKVSGNKGDTLILSGWAKGNAAPDNMDGAEPDGTVNDRVFGLVVTFNYNSGYTEDGTTVTAPFNPDVENWQYTAAPIVAEYAYNSVTVDVVYDYNVNTMLFDGIQLYKEEFGTSYEYDADGNVKKVIDIQKQTTNYKYENNNLTKVMLPTGAELTYDYDNYHNVETATSATGLVYEFEYDDYGNNTKVSITRDGKTLSSSAEYTNNGNTLAFTTDAAGKETHYSYDPNTNVLLWVQYPNDTDASRTEYTYDNMYRLASTEMDVGANTLSASYTYTDDLLTKIQTGSTTYNFTYGSFSLRSAVKVGSRTLASYSYTDDGRNALSSLDYDNGDKVQYTYDTQGRVTKQTYEDGDTVTYQYDNNGALAKVKDSASGRTATYFYDFTDRLCKYTESASSYSFSMVTTYDNQNRVTEALETTNGYARSIWYNYDSANRLISYQKGWAREIYQYDSFGRQRYHFTSYRDTTVLTNIYTYETPADDKTTSRVAAFTNRYGGRDVVDRYTYDDNGNILTISDGTYTTSYTYDTANQLTRENNQKAGKTWVWTYDNAGNILSRKEYAYTTGTLGTALDTVSYGYTDSAWGDLLTSYDGKAITTDEIGNMLTGGTYQVVYTKRKFFNPNGVVRE